MPIKVDLKELASRWPSPFVARTEIRNFSGGLISEKYIANLDSQGAGPEGRFKIGRKVGYPVISFLASEEYKKFFAQKFNAFVPKDKDEFAKYLFSLSN